MSENWQYGTTAGQDPAASADPTRSRRPRRSITDRKIAGVAGGLGRAFRIDPVLLRVAFVVLTIFGGFGGLLYVLAWLLLPGDNDEVSAAEALLGRGRSSVPPVLAVGLGIIAVISLFSMFSWGLPFWPLVVAGTVVAIVMHKRSAGGGCQQHRGRQRGWQDHAERHARRWDARAERQARRWGARAEQWAEHASTFGDRAERWVAQQPWNRNGSSQSSVGRSDSAPGGTTDPPTSPFDRPAFWETPSTADRVSAPPPRVRMDKAETPVDAPRTPPAWDPLGVAPFAWDLPEPTPVPSAPSRPTRGGGVISRVTMGLTLLAGGLAAAGIIAGWWALTWAQVSAIALSVVALGLLVSALRGRGYALVGPGVFLSLVTLALTVTGISGTEGFGSYNWHPYTVAQVQPSYEINAGQGHLDLSQLDVPAGTTQSVQVEVHAGHAVITLPSDTRAVVECEADAGRVDCLGLEAQGFDNQQTATQPGSSAHGELDLTVKVGAGFAEVQNG